MTTTTSPAAAGSTGTARTGEVTSTSNAITFVLRRTGVTAGTVLLSSLLLGVAWWAALKFLDANAFIAKTPLDVWKYLFVTDAAAKTTAGENRELLVSLLWVTLGHAAIGFVVGVVASVLVAMAFTLFRPAEFMFMPIAMLMRTVPLLAMAPVIYMIFKDGVVTAGLIGTVVVFFPLLVNLTLGFRSVSPMSVDLIRAYGGSRWTIMRKVAVPSALPHFFASMRIAVPGSITGAMLYEWLFTSGDGLGGIITIAKSQSQYSLIWSIAVFVTVVSILLYTVATFVEAAVLAKWGPNAGKAHGR